MNTISQTRVGLLPSSTVSRALLIAVGVGTLVGAGFGLGLLTPATEIAQAEQLSALAALPEAVEPAVGATAPPAHEAVRLGSAAPEQVDPALIGLEPQQRLAPAEPAVVEDAVGTNPRTGQPGPGQFYVQVAAFRQQEVAETRAKALATNGQQARSIQEGRWYVVRLGPFATRGEAEKQRLALARSERRDAFVLPRSNGLYHVQVASFESKQVAERIAKGYRDAGHSTKVTRVRMAGKHWHCVRVGPFDTRQEAQSYQKLIADRPGIETRVIPFEPATTP